MEFSCNRYQPWCEAVTMSDGTEYVFLGGGDPDTCAEGDVEGIEEYSVSDNNWNIAERHSGITASGPSAKACSKSSLLYL